MKIRTRLTLFYSLAVFILLSVAAGFLYWVTITLLYKADYEFLGDEIETIQYILMTGPLDMVALKEAVVEAPLEPDGSIYHYYIRVYDQNKKLLIETPGSGDVLQDEDYFYKSSELLGKKRYFWYSKNDSDYLMIQAPLEIGSKNNIGLVQVALDISYQYHLIQDRKFLISGVLAGVLVALLLGFLIANRGLRSLYVLTETMQKISAKSLNQRINLKSLPAELTGIGKAFNEMLERMETSFTRLKQFSADLSHELRTPITNLIGETEISLSYANSMEEYRMVMESNLEELQRISSLIENILFLARAENPQYEVKKVALEVNKEIDLVCEFYQAMADEKNIQIFNEGEATVYANPDMFRRLISNILSNALKYTPLGGWAKFQVSNLESDDVKITLTDNGIGISKENLPKIFDRFYRIDSSRSESGVGLGLSIVKSIVSVHRGSISIQSELLKGTSITIILPKMTKL